MSNSRVSSLIYSSGLSKAGVVKRVYPADISFLKATAIFIFISDIVRFKDNKMFLLLTLIICLYYGSG